MLLIYAALFLHIWHSSHTILYIDTEIIRQTYELLSCDSDLRSGNLYYIGILNIFMKLVYTIFPWLFVMKHACVDLDQIHFSLYYYYFLICVCLSQVARARLEEEYVFVYTRPLYRMTGIKWIQPKQRHYICGYIANIYMCDREWWGGWRRRRRRCGLRYNKTRVQM